MKFGTLFKVTGIMFSPFIFAFFVFVFEFRVLGDEGVVSLANWTWSIFQFTSISRAYLSSNDVGFLYYWAFWLITFSTLIALSIVSIACSLQDKFKYLEFSKNPNRKSYIPLFVIAFVYFGVSGLYIKNILGTDPWFPASNQGRLFFMFTFEGSTIIGFASFIKLLSFIDSKIRKIGRRLS